MSVRFNRTGTGVVRDHHDLANKGVHTHAELDLIVEEVDAARGGFADLDARLTYIQSHSTGGGGGGGGGLPSNYLYEPYRPRADGETLVQLTLGAYEVGTGELEVFRNGIRQKRGAQFFERSRTSYELTEPLLLTDLVVARVRDRSGILLPARLWTETVPVTDPARLLYPVGRSFQGSGESLEVYVNGVLQAVGEDYETGAGGSVSFAQGLEPGSLLFFQVVDKKVEIRPKQLEEFLATDGSTVRFALTAFAYTVGANELELYLNGVRLLPEQDYIELDSSTFELLQPPPVGELLACRENGKKTPTEEALEQRVRQLEADMMRLFDELGMERG